MVEGDVGGEEDFLLTNTLCLLVSWSECLLGRWGRTCVNRWRSMKKY